MCLIVGCMGSRRQRVNRRSARLHANANELDLLRIDSPSLLALHASLGTEPTRFHNQVVYTGGVMHPELRMANGYQGPVVVECNGIEFDKDTPVNRDHEPKRPVAHCTDVHSDGQQFYASGVFSLDNADSREITTGKTFPWKPSVGLVLIEWRLVREGETLRANGRIFQGPVLHVTKSRLKHIAIVTEPGDTNVDPLILANLNSQTGNSGMDFAQWLASMNVDAATLTPEALAVFQAQFDATQSQSANTATGQDGQANGMDANGTGGSAAASASAAAANATANASNASNALFAGANGANGFAGGVSPDQQTLTANYRATIAAEEARANSLRTLCTRFGNPTVSIGGQSVHLAAHAIAAGWTPERTELEARRHQELEATRNARPNAPFVHSRSRSERAGSLETLQAGLLLRANIALDSPRFNSPTIRNRLPEWLRAGINDPNRQRIMDNAQEFRGLSMLEACAHALHASTGQHASNNRLDMLEAAFSSGAVTHLFGATLGAQVLVSYAEIQDFSSEWCQERENPDMELHNRIRMEAAGDLSLHPAGGEAEHATRSTRAEQAKVDRFSRQMNIDEADFMSDNFGKLADTPRDFGLAAGRVRPNLVAAVILGNPTLLVTGRTLFNATDLSDLGTGNPLAQAAMSLAISRLGLRRDGDASLNLAPTHLLVPPALQDTAIRLCESGVIQQDGGVGELNALKRYGIKPVAEARLQNGLIDPVSRTALAGSATNYFLVSSEAHTIEVTYLEGAGRVPIVKSEPLTGGAFGLNITVRHYVGARAMDFRGFVRGQA